MGSNDKAFSGSIPYIYEQFMVPLIFAPYARDLAQRIAQSRPRKLLETAAGTGVLTRALAATLPAGAAITATDLNEPMLAQAKATLPDPRVEWRQADALALPFDDASFEVVACQFGVMFFPDRVKGHAEARRVLAPGGRLVFNTWERIEENEFPDVVMQALAEVFPHDPPRFMARTPHGYHDPDLIRSANAAGANADAGDLTLVAREAILQSPDSVVKARAELGVAGEIVRAAPETNLAEELGRLAAEIPSEERALLDPCEARRSNAGSVSQTAAPLAGDSPEALLPLAPAAGAGEGGAGDGCPTR